MECSAWLLTAASEFSNPGRPLAYIRCRGIQGNPQGISHYALAAS